MFVPLSVLEFRDRAAMFFGDKIGVIDGEAQFTYREFATRTHRLANALVELGVEAGDRVSFITFNTHHLLEAYYGVIEAGAVLNPINIRLAPHEIEYILGHAASKVVFVHRDFAPLVEEIRPRLAPRPTVVVLDGEPGGIADHEYEALLASGSTDPRHPDIDENAMAELFYTSGTTGLPKGVAMTHRELYLHSLAAEIGLGFTEDDVVLHVVPLFHVNGWGTPHFLTMVGGRHVILRRFDPGALMALVERHRVTRLLAVPTIFNALLHSRERSRYDLSSLRQLIIGGSPASPDLVRALESELGTQAIVGYGLTETSPIVTLAQPRRVLTDSEPAERRQERQAMTGWAIPGVRIRVVDADGSDVRPDGEQIGEIVVRGNTVMDGYYRDPEATEATDPRRLAPHRRHGHHRRGGLRPHQGPLEGHHHQLRREHVVGRDRDRARPRTRASSSARSSRRPTTSAARSPSRSSSSSPTWPPPRRSCGLTAASGSPPTRSRARSTSGTRCRRAAPARSSRPSCASRSGSDSSRGSTEVARRPP